MLDIVCVVGLALYGFNAFWLTWHFLRRPLPESIPAEPVEWPAVTVQLPVYNEQHVVERLIDACAELDYPSDKLQIQILDDSDDITTAIAEQRAQAWRLADINIHVIRRTDRHGYKAGALAHALPLATGEFLALFDADFKPGARYLKDTLPYFYQSGNETVGFVQTRWGHLNAGYSPLTRCQALALDGHFVIEQTGRNGPALPSVSTVLPVSGVAPALRTRLSAAGRLILCAKIWTLAIGPNSPAGAVGFARTWLLRPKYRHNCWLSSASSFAGPKVVFRRSASCSGL